MILKESNFENKAIFITIWTVNNIGVKGARMISESLKTNTTLTELNLYSDEIEVKKKIE